MKKLKLNRLKENDLKNEKMRKIKGGVKAVPCCGSRNEEYGSTCDSGQCDGCYYKEYS